MKKPKSKQRLKPLYDKAAKAMQDAHRRDPRPCACCGKQAEVLHHWQSWANSVALRFEDMNLVPLTAACHCAFHSRADIKQKKRIERYMQDLYGDNWEDLLLVVEQVSSPLTHCEKIDYLHDIINQFKE